MLPPLGVLAPAGEAPTDASSQRGAGLDPIRGTGHVRCPPGPVVTSSTTPGWAPFDLSWREVAIRRC